MSKQKGKPSDESTETMFDESAVVTVTDQPENILQASDKIEASALRPGLECPFTDKCRGRVRMLNSKRVLIPIKNEAGETIGNDLVEQYQCDKCKAIAAGYRSLRKTYFRDKPAGSSRMFNRQTGQSE